MRNYLFAFGLLAIILAACRNDDSSQVSPQLATPNPGVVAGIDTLTGLIAEGDYLLVKGNCLACHSANLITQQGATAEGWTEMIHWMQEKQGLWDLGKQHGPIVNYLATYYAPRETGRRPPLEEVEWYELEKK